MFERFTDRARQVVVFAQDDARALRHNYIGTEHILMGLLHEGEGLAARVLASLGVTVQDVRAQVVRMVGTGGEAVTGQIPFTEHARNALNLAQREALSVNNNFIGTEHLLLGLVNQRESRAAEILSESDAGTEKIRDEIIRMIGGPRRRQTDEGFPPDQSPYRTLGLRRVVPLAQQLSDGTWVVSVEIWDHSLVASGLARFRRRRHALPAQPCSGRNHRDRQPAGRLPLRH